MYKQVECLLDGIHWDAQWYVQFSGVLETVWWERGGSSPRNDDIFSTVLNGHLNPKALIGTTLCEIIL